MSDAPQRLRDAARAAPGVCASLLAALAVVGAGAGVLSTEPLPDLGWLVAGNVLAAAALYGTPAAPTTRRILVALALWSGAEVARALLAFAAGDASWLAVALWGPTAATAPLAAWATRPGEAWFRVAQPASPGWNLAKTSLQIAFFWTLFLVVAPAVIVAAERSLGLPSLPPQPVLALALGLPLGVGSLASGYVMSTRGHGTPLPLDTAATLVIAGPYRVVRNPMALTGLGLGAAVGVGLGSPGTLAMCALGAVVWDRAVRPIEEADLEVRFGEPFRAYRDAVRCWIPRWPPYRPGT